MNFAKTIRLTLALGLLAAGSFGHAEEQHSIMTALSSTTLSGYVDTSGSWWVGTQNTSNDFVQNAFAVETNHVAIATDLTTSTLELGEPAQPNQTGSVWYKWGANQTGVARISIKTNTVVTPVTATSTIPALSEESIFYPDGGITFITVGSEVTMIGGIGEVMLGSYQRWWTDLVVYHLVKVSETESRLEFVQRGGSLEFNVQAGEIFWVGVEVYQGHPSYDWEPEIPSSLPTELFFDLTATPVNDSFASTFSVADSACGSFSGYTLGATREPGEPELGGDFSGASVWFHYIAATYGTVAFGSQFNTAPFAVFTGNELPNLKLVTKASAGATTFFGDEGKTYHIAVYRNENTTTGFWLGFTAPKYRLYETNVDGLFPGGATPHFYGVRGVTMLMYAKQATGWQSVEIEPIVDRATDLLIQPRNVVDGQLRIVTIDDPLPPPHVEFVRIDGSLAASVVGIPGQTCAVSSSSDLVNWSQPQVITLLGTTVWFGKLDPLQSNYFYRVTQSLPIPPMTQIPIGVVHTGVGGGNIPPPPVPIP